MQLTGMFGLIAAHMVAGAEQIGIMHLAVFLEFRGPQFLAATRSGLPAGITRKVLTYRRTAPAALPWQFGELEATPRHAQGLLAGAHLMTQQCIRFRVVLYVTGAMLTTPFQEEQRPQAEVMDGS